MEPVALPSLSQIHGSAFLPLALTGQGEQDQLAGSMPHSSRYILSILFILSK